jgi:hypothetical protein
LFFFSSAPLRYDSCSEYLYSVQEKLGIWNNGVVYALYRYAAGQGDELSFDDGDRIVVVRKGDDVEREWWWSRSADGREGYVPRNLFGLYPRVEPSQALLNVNAAAGRWRGGTDREENEESADNDQKVDDKDDRADDYGRPDEML